MRNSDITRVLESYAPLALQEGYDNCGYQVGDPSAECTGVLLAVDATPEVVDEAVDLGCNLVISHHPLLFKGLKKITGSTRVENTVLKAIRAGVTVYSLHTAVDSAPGGVSWAMASKLGLRDTATLDPVSHKLLKLSVFVPHSHLSVLKDALFEAGAGSLGCYDRCSYAVKGEGSFRPLAGANPFVGTHGCDHIEPETRLEVLLPAWLKRQVEKALLDVHPYECPAYDFVMLENESPSSGLGVVGNLASPLSPVELADLVKAKFGSPVVRCNRPAPDLAVSRVALCGGSGSSLIPCAIAAGAQAFITSDTSYHSFVDFTGSVFILDIGHFESEECSKDIFYHVITEFFTNFAVHYSKFDSNPIIYL